MTAPEALVYDQNADALSRRTQVLKGLAGSTFEVVSVGSPTALLVRAQVAPEGSIALIDLCDSDRDPTTRSGEQLIKRVMRLGIAAHAWTAHASPDVVASALDAGALSVISTHAADEQSRLAAACSGEQDRYPLATSRLATWASWFEARYGCSWQPWMEPVLVRLASTGERGAHAQQLVAAGVAPTPRAGAARQRELAQILAADRYRTPKTVAASASLVLNAIASYRPLHERPSRRASVLHACRALDEQPSIIAAAALSDHEVRTLRTIAASMLDRRARETRGVGAPLAGEIEDELFRAAGHIARDIGAAAPDDVEQIARGIVRDVEAIALAVSDALDDELFAPHARAAAALLQLSRHPASRPVAQVQWDRTTPMWQGLDALELSVATAQAPAELISLTAAIDETLRLSHS